MIHPTFDQLKSISESLKELDISEVESESAFNILMIKISNFT